MFLTTESYLDGYSITERLGIVYGVSVFSLTLVGNFLGSLRATFGGKQRGYTKLLIENRDDAISNLIAEAEQLGADAVIGLRLDTNEFDAGEGQITSKVVAYGTAVKIVKKGVKTQLPSDSNI
ncbi:MAG: YbjQ family protein [Desulfurella sp.]